MDTWIIVIVVAIALEHAVFLILEMFYWTKPLGRKIFSLSQTRAQESRVLAANQGLYNGFLVAGLFWGLLYPDAIVGLEIVIFFLLCITTAGIYGGRSVNKRLFYVQALPALLTLFLILIGNS